MACPCLTSQARMKTLRRNGCTIKGLKAEAPLSPAKLCSVWLAGAFNPLRPLRAAQFCSMGPTMEPRFSKGLGWVPLKGGCGSGY